MHDLFRFTREGEVKAFAYSMDAHSVYLSRPALLVRDARQPEHQIRPHVHHYRRDG